MGQPQESAGLGGVLFMVILVSCPIHTTLNHSAGERDHPRAVQTAVRRAMFVSQNSGDERSDGNESVCIGAWMRSQHIDHTIRDAVRQVVISYLAKSGSLTQQLLVERRDVVAGEKPIYVVGHGRTDHSASVTEINPSVWMISTQRTVGLMPHGAISRIIVVIQSNSEPSDLIDIPYVAASAAGRQTA